ncbi:MAG: transcriptional regulator with XRE-family HTH domain [Alphaproteobacteria bacterium]|jgi:transcriptional regulator with XRE-family HTH domain
MSRKTVPLDQHIGLRLKMRRIMVNMTQEQLADQVGITFQQIQKYEKATNRISAARLYELAQILKIDVTYFYEGYNSTMVMREDITIYIPNKNNLNNNDVMSALVSMPSGTQKTHIFNAIKQAFRQG